MKKILLTAMGGIGIAPGLIVIQSGLGAPPRHGLLFGGVIAAFGTLTLFVLWVNRVKIANLSSRRVTKSGIHLIILCFIFIAFYVVAFNYCVVSHIRGTAYYPLWITGDVANMVERAGSRRAAIERYGIAAVVQAIDRMPEGPQQVTTIILLLIYQGAFTSLTVAFGLLGFHQLEAKDDLPSQISHGLASTDAERNERAESTAAADPATPLETVEVFYSYAHGDEAMRDKLTKHLSLLQRQGFIKGWHDREITAGTEWKGEIDEHLNSARVVLLLVSADFLASDYCWDVEMKRAMERHELKEARVIPVILRDVDWHASPFGKLQALPRNGKPVTSWPNEDEAFADIARGIRRALEELQNNC